MEDFIKKMYMEFEKKDLIEKIMDFIKRKKAWKGFNIKIWILFKTKEKIAYTLHFKDFKNKKYGIQDFQIFSSRISYKLNV